jgi:hypothetical protein
MAPEEGWVGIEEVAAYLRVARKSAFASSQGRRPMAHRAHPGRPAVRAASVGLSLWQGRPLEVLETTGRQLERNL